MFFPNDQNSVLRGAGWIKSIEITYCCHAKNSVALLGRAGMLMFELECLG
jgi:hypothetical protein